MARGRQKQKTRAPPPTPTPSPSPPRRSRPFRHWPEWPSEPLTAQQIDDLLIEHKRKFPDVDASSEDESDAEEEEEEEETRLCMEDTVQGDIEPDERGDSFHQASLEDSDIMRAM